MKKLILVIALLLISNIVFAEDLKDKVSFVKETGGKKEYLHIKGNRYEVEDVLLTSEYSYKKPKIDQAKDLNSEEKDVVEYSLKEMGRKLVHKEVRPAKNDYGNDYDKGTVSYTPKARNYSFHKVIIPDGTVIRDTNFTQKNPFTEAIKGKNLTFIDCNLSNVKWDSTWTNQGSNNTQFKKVKKSEKDLGDGKKEVTISFQVQEDKPNGEFKELEEEIETTDNSDSYNLLILSLSE